MSVDIYRVEDTLADAGVETEYYGDDEITSYIIRNGGQSIELINAVSGNRYRSYDLTEAVYTDSVGDLHNVTRTFEDVDSYDEFITAVNDTFGTVV